MLAVLLAAALGLADGGDWRRFEAALRAGQSATALLQQWCDTAGGGARIEALRVRTDGPSADLAVRRRLRASADETVAYRHVDLACAGLVLSRADNWYLPARLTPEMNRILAATDQPFGAVVKDLGFHRRLLAMSETALSPGESLRVRAILIDNDGRPFSLVEEHYSAVLRSPVTQRSAQ
jgi:hypothetical protein